MYRGITALNLSDQLKRELGKPMAAHLGETLRNTPLSCLGQLTHPPSYRTAPNHHYRIVAMSTQRCRPYTAKTSIIKLFCMVQASRRACTRG